MQCLQVELVGALGRHELHGRALHRFSNRLGVAIVVLFTLAIRAYVFRRHQSGIVAKRLKLATEMMRSSARLHADEARWQVGKPRFHLAARPFLPQHDPAAPILANEVERVLADIDADHGDFAIEFLRHGVLLCLRCPLPAWLAGGAGARPDHPIHGGAKKPGTERTAIMRMITTSLAALGFVGAMAVATPSPTLAQGIYFGGPGVEFGIGPRYHRYYRD